MKILTQAKFVCAFAAFLMLPVFVISSPAHSAPKEVRYREAALNFQPGDRLVINGLRASVRILAAPQGQLKGSLRVRKVLPDPSTPAARAHFDALSISLRRVPGAVLLEAKGPSGRSDLMNWLSSSGPQMMIQIEAPPVPVELSLHGGDVQVENWRAPLALQMVDGTVRTSGTSGVLKVLVQKGEIKIESHRGRAEVEGYLTRIAVQKVEGDLHLQNFRGESIVRDTKGGIEIQSSMGGTSVVKSSGSLQFDLSRGGLAVQDFEGSVRGWTDTGAVHATVSGEADVNIESSAGSVTVRVSSNSGAYARLRTETGALLVPSTLQISKGNSVQLAAGRLSGTDRRGSILVRSKSGTIRVK